MKHRLVQLASLAAALTGCSREAPPAPASVSSAPPLASATTPAAALDAMDERTPVPLLPMMALHQKRNMRDHLVAVQEIVGALATDDFPAIERAAGRMGLSESMGQTCTHMGAAAPGFTAQALAFHRTADAITSVAKARDRAAVTTAFGVTLKACTSCHATWKQQVVDEPAWQRRTGAEMAPPSHGGGR